MKEVIYDVVVIGAGPAGCVCAHQLRDKNLKVALIDKAIFPRDKICGDALSADVLNQLNIIDATIFENFIQQKTKIASNGVRFFAPDGAKLDIDFKNPKHHDAAGFVMKRIDFDNFLFEQIKDAKHISIFQNEKITKVSDDGEIITIIGKNETYKTKLVIGADGANSIINRQLAKNKLDKNNHCAGLRQYYENVSGFHEKNHIELHFYKDVLPGYFWIFPLSENRANVGLGMLSSEVSRKNINLKEKLKDIIENHPNIKERFKSAKALEEIQGFGLPIGSKKKPLSGNRFLLLGDAANLIDPFTGEGIGNAIRSGRVAAEHIENAFKQNRFDAAFNKNYDKIIYKKMWNELRLGHSLQKLLRYPWLFNFLVKKANKNEAIQQLLTSMLDNVDLKKELVKPRFYFRLLFNY